MARQVTRYVQGRLFAAGAAPSGRAERPRALRYGGSPVTRDPAVALAYAEAQHCSHGVTLGLVRILAERSPEERAAIRALLAKPHVA